MQIQMSNIASVFSTRPKAHEVFDDVQNGKEIVLDFLGVQMASPSFLQETLIIFGDRDVEVRMLNMSDAIKLQLSKARGALADS